MNVDAEAIAAVEPAPGPVATGGRSVLRWIAWALIGAAIAAFVVAGDVRTAWIVGDLEPIDERVALPRIASLLLLLGLALHCVHQLRARRALPADRYRGPAILALVALSIGVAVLVTLPYQRTLNLLFEGGRPDVIPLLVWQTASQLAMLCVAWLAVLRPKALPGHRLFADPAPVRHAVIGIVGGVLGFALVLGASVLEALLRTGVIPPIFSSDVPITMWTPGFPMALAAGATILLTPIAEELFFRGVALEAWRHEYGTAVALIGSSVLFGLIHFGLTPIEFLPSEAPRRAILAVSGLIFAVLALRTGSLIAPIAAHATLNGIPFAIAFALSQ